MYKKRHKWPEDRAERLEELSGILSELWETEKRKRENGDETAMQPTDFGEKAIENNPNHSYLRSAAWDKGITWVELRITSGIPIQETRTRRRHTQKQRKFSSNRTKRLKQVAKKIEKIHKKGVKVYASAITLDKKYRYLIAATNYVPAYTNIPSSTWRTDPEMKEKAKKLKIKWQEVLEEAKIPLEDRVKKVGRPRKKKD